MKPSPELREVLSAYLRWAENGAPRQRCYERGLTLSTGTGAFQFRLDCGLCWNVTRSAGRYTPVARVDVLGEELRMLFESSGLDAAYPFGHGEYEEDSFCNSHHRNQRRLQWLRDTLEKAE